MLFDLFMKKNSIEKETGALYDSFVHFQITILNRNVEKLHLGNQLMQSKI